MISMSVLKVLFLQSLYVFKHSFYSVCVSVCLYLCVGGRTRDWPPVLLLQKPCAGMLIGMTGLSL